MKAMNLYLLTRAAPGKDFSMLAKELSGAMTLKEYSRHEAKSLRSLTDALVPYLRENVQGRGSWISFLDGFYFSFTIAHISKEFDLLKISGDGACVLNIELKSEAITEDRVYKQLAQNRYYLSHISNSIYSFTYVMETDTLYVLNDKGYMRTCSPHDLAEALAKPAFASYVEKDPDAYFRAADYLISPAAMPEKFLQGNYFLTNQQAEFKRKILETLREQDAEEEPYLITVSGTAGTGKTLLLFDLAMSLSKKKKVLFVHGGKLLKGHRVIDERLRNVDILSADQFEDASDYAYLLIDEANRISPDMMDSILSYVRSRKIPYIMAYDPHLLAGREEAMIEAEERIEDLSGLSLVFTGNIRINRPVYSFLRVLFQKKERPPAADYSCIDIIYAADQSEALSILSYYRELGYQKITLPGESASIGEGLNADEIIGLEYDCVLLILDADFYYDENDELRFRGQAPEEALNLLYEGISRTRERLCLLVCQNEKLFRDILSLKEHAAHDS